MTVRLERVLAAFAGLNVSIHKSWTKLLKNL